MADKDYKDERLHQVLQAWTIEAPVPPRFQEQVWRGIARSNLAREISWWSGFLTWVQTALPRPALAVSYLAVFLAAGLMTGYWQAQVKSARVDALLGERYVQSITPYGLAQR